MRPSCMIPMETIMGNSAAIAMTQIPYLIHMEDTGANTLPTVSIIHTGQAIPTRLIAQGTHIQVADGILSENSINNN